MIVEAHLPGRLGNQLFAFAHGLAWADRFAAPLEVAGGADLRRVLGLQFARAGQAPASAPSVTLADFGGSPAVVELGRLPAHWRLRLRGFWQAEGCFAPVADCVRGMLQAAVYPVLPSPCPPGRTPVWVQVRRGDFVTKSRHNLCGPGYFRAAVSLMRARLVRPWFYVASDDPAFCQELFGGEPDFAPIQAGSELVDWSAASACRAHIISNSSFGWWGAWIRESGPVVCPSRWVRDRRWDCAPARWVKLPV